MISLTFAPIPFSSFKNFESVVEKIKLTGSFAEYNLTDNGIFVNGSSEQILFVPNRFTGKDFIFV